MTSTEGWKWSGKKPNEEWNKEVVKLFISPTASAAFTNFIVCPHAELWPICTFYLPVHRAALRADISAFVQRYLRPCPEISPSLPADISARTRRYLCPRAFMPRLIPPTAYYFPNLSYSASVTGSSHSLEVFSPGISKARWANQLSAAAPCQCFTLAGMWMTSPGSICTASLPSS